ncbi:TPA: MFS transporter [Klebsiella pneumoniae]|uniref:MFS transporter n=1 Tax=Klebsiella pneumoniae TaxID=573 RepID=UPI001033EF6A|nr:MFS transporter [Klebsiella pneumoniae]VAO38658.1 Nucleoside permease NupG [Klebsiella pneumoniae]HBW1602710.1 nucleoside permease [Klebsiella pneumoniae]HBY0059701.1 MFS transporter [Klebsiella pneumoniae]HDQ3431802.1 MFS transporter [Klebsiella pneumoniae]
MPSYIVEDNSKALGPVKSNEKIVCDESNAKPAYIFSRLSILMLMQFIVFGSWFATMGLVLFTYNLGSIIGMAYTLCAIAAIISPLIFGAVGDRLISSEKILGALHMLGGIVQFIIPKLVVSGNTSLILIFIFIYMIFFQPTQGLVNSLSFQHLGSKSDLYPYLRLFATGGWAVGGFIVGILGYSSTVGIFYVAGLSSIVLGSYSFTLPSTHPRAKKQKFNLLNALGFSSLQLFKHKNFAILMVCALLTSISLGVYNTYASTFIGALGIPNVASVMALGQISEVAFIVLVPFVIKRIGMKWALLIGMAMWGIRFIMFILAAKGHHWTAIVGVGLHGICNDFFLIISAMYIDRLAPPELKVQAQSWLIIAISGFGAAFGSLISGYVYSLSVDPAQIYSWIMLWSIPISIAVLTSVVWLMGFNEE